MAKFCRNCGARLDDAAKVCGHCGTPVAHSNSKTFSSPTSVASPNRGQIRPYMKWAIPSILGGIAVVTVAVGAVVHFTTNNHTTAPAPTTNQNVVSENSGETNSDIAANSSAADQTEDGTDATEEIQEQLVTVQLVRGGDFSDGFAWVFYNEDGAEKIGIINTDGVILPFSMEEAPANACNSIFSDGYSYINYNGEDQSHQFMIVDTQGNITASSPEDGDYQVVTGADGVYLIQQTVLSMTENETKYGILKADGSWICRPGEQTILEPSDPEQKEYYGERGNISYSYYGDHIFGASYKTKSDSLLCLYNADTSQTVEFSDTSIKGDFENGETIVTSGSDIYRLGTDFSLTLVMTDRPDGPVYYKNGTFFTGQTEYSSTGPNPCIKNGKFYNTDGSVKVDLSQYTLVEKDAEGLYRYVDGYAAVVIYGADSIGYMAILDENGQFTFEPVKLSSVNSDSDMIGIFSDGAIPIQKQSEGWGILTKDGAFVATNIPSGNVDSLVFHEGYAWHSEDEIGYYVATDGSSLTAVVKSSKG